jgi:DNA-binding LytR/AlgR family response regulator
VEKEPVQSGGKREMLFLEAENGKDYLQIPLDGLLFIASADNYVEVYWESEGMEQKELLRNTLKNLSRELTTHSQLFRCHRSYLVNLEKVEKVTGNSQGYKLHIGSHVIPVSRNHNTAIKNRLRDIYQG